ncbi:bifunctional [glutamine synthetase] adenylyltransferase/[glutamine synthetase]-adenylyl-L-tyrosine phosphorylase [Kordiimonas aquimaris]|uniref:bifunctional [glutamine synthetase] adenylyltransferase/[glutamine synthetase]-adenylyl-L-tyrosine phosphorylase n=1 Tax=Kordiimonas aquimaris TaxID=707591 RepID=UPI0021D3756E|nr:bifunctional [glutamine synthetase] adenylyltransferase/[glutamine synthetase]-adenylyl-L-tyrosine phosphorylase [Kordiimonas aquimaris]
MLPKAFDPDKATEVYDSLYMYTQEASLPSPDRNVIDAIFGNSRFLASLALRYPHQTVTYLTTDPEENFNDLISLFSEPRPAKETDSSFMAFLREQKNQAALLIACADITHRWDLNKTTNSLSILAEKCLSSATDKAFFNTLVRGNFEWPQGVSFEAGKEIEFVPTSISKHSGYFILGMGKLGAHELNYSSDIDLIALYDPLQVKYIGRKTPADCFIRMTQEIVRYIDERTMNGYVFRVDLRLRPDPSATPVAINVSAAINYYHSVAVNWERAAMIKARYIAGDAVAANLYLKEMSGWVWRRNMDYEALKDIAAIKNQINRHYDTKETSFEGYDVKLGIGGIREIEFYAQVNQLLHAGRHPALRLRGTLETLDALAAADLINSDTATTLSAAYRYLRDVEHRIQMLNDEQTHIIPTDPVQRERLTTFMGYKDASDFNEELKKHTQIVSACYDTLLPESVLEKTNPTLKTLASTMKDGGFEDIEAAKNIINGWQRGRYKSLKTARARDLLTECLSTLLTALSGGSSPDSALVRFDSFLSQLPAGVQLFSLLKSNPALFRLLGRVMSLAPALASILAKSPNLWDAVLDGAFFEPITSGDEMQNELSAQISTARDFQDVLDLVRRFVAEQKFRTGVQLLEGIADAQEVGKALSGVADYALQILIPIVEAEFAEKHGTFGDEHSGISMVALGKYGGEELTHTSDIDVIFLYDTKATDSFSDGPKPLMPNVYYARLAQHILTAITALTPEGRLFEVDTRLRPSGSQGPLAVTVTTLAEYYKSNAWTWEFLALTRARVIYAPKSMKRIINKVITTALTYRKNAKSLKADTVNMRQKLRTEFDTNNPFEVKHSAGGLVDIEFICQYLMLVNINKHTDIIDPNILGCIQKLAACNVLNKDDAKQLTDGYILQQQVQAMLRLCLETVPDTLNKIPDELANTLSIATGYQNKKDMHETLLKSQSLCQKLYVSIVET